MRSTILISSVLLSALALTACASTQEAEDETMCKQVKPGVVTTVNHYCVVMLDDPVNPEVVREHNGQRIGFCCAGCLRTWGSWSDAQKDAAIAKAVAKGKPPA